MTSEIKFVEQIEDGTLVGRGEYVATREADGRISVTETGTSNVYTLPAKCQMEADAISRSMYMRYSITLLAK